MSIPLVSFALLFA